MWTLRKEGKNHWFFFLLILICFFSHSLQSNLSERFYCTNKWIYIFVICYIYHIIQYLITSISHRCSFSNYIEIIISRFFLSPRFWSFFDSFNISLPSQNKFIITYQFLYRFYLLSREESFFPLVFCVVTKRISFMCLFYVFIFKQHTWEERNFTFY